ncbi:hypothetical protein ACSAZL_03030 [Methanosarcina sp. T3]|uniref:hypothetical protein n=1 Tax=Methanosarcina sp. T3 TaxID=3439062 RepID=UPI003F84E9B9
MGTEIYSDRGLVGRSWGKRVYAVTKNIFNAGKFLDTTVERVNVKILFTALCYIIALSRSY